MLKDRANLERALVVCSSGICTVSYSLKVTSYVTFSFGRLLQKKSTHRIMLFITRTPAPRTSASEDVMLRGRLHLWRLLRGLLLRGHRLRGLRSPRTLAQINKQFFFSEQRRSQRCVMSSFSASGRYQIIRTEIKNEIHFSPLRQPSLIC